MLPPTAALRGKEGVLRMKFVLYIASLCLVVAGALAGPGVAVAGDGTMVDASGTLMWKRCSEGQRWIDGQCTGTALPHTWDEARAMAEVSPFAGHDDWRLPTLDELRHLHGSADRGKLAPTTIDTYWTATAVAHGSDGAFIAALDGGNAEAGGYAVARPGEGHAVCLVCDLR
jgi:hypothetical protein